MAALRLLFPISILVIFGLVLLTRQPPAQPEPKIGSSSKTSSLRQTIAGVEYPKYFQLQNTLPSDRRLAILAENFQSSQKLKQLDYFDSEGNPTPLDVHRVARPHNDETGIEFLTSYPDHPESELVVTYAKGQESASGQLNADTFLTFEAHGDFRYFFSYLAEDFMTIDTIAEGREGLRDLLKTPAPASE